MLHISFTASLSLIFTAGFVGALADEPGEHHHPSTHEHPKFEHWNGKGKWNSGPRQGGYGTDGSTLWYGGDFDGRAALNDERNNYQGTSAIYENFMVSGGGWQVTGVFANLLFNYGSSGADFEIRSGVSEGNGGTLLFSGAGQASTQVETGRSWQGWTESTLKIDNLSVFLAPGEYWLVVRSVTFGCGGGYLLSRGGSTSGANSIGEPIGDGNSYYTQTGYNFVPTEQLLGSGTWDFSFGVNGSVVPEPNALGFMAAGISLLLLRRRR